MSATAFLMIFYPIIVKKLGRIRLMGWLAVLSMVGYLMMMISILNTVEYNEYRYGTRDEAIIAILRPFLSKLSSALIVLITSGCYMLFGITEFTNQISYFENQASKGSITEAVLRLKPEAITLHRNTEVSADCGRNHRCTGCCAGHRYHRSSLRSFADTGHG